MAVVRACDGLMQSKSVHAMRKDHVACKKFVEATAEGGGRRLLESTGRGAPHLAEISIRPDVSWMLNSFRASRPLNSESGLVEENWPLIFVFAIFGSVIVNCRVL